VTRLFSCMNYSGESNVDVYRGNLVGGAATVEGEGGAKVGCPNPARSHRRLTGFRLLNRRSPAS
jgi:hypothetical protein